ncbi:class II aldolase/adducin family protein [Nonomuraea sp. MG754425]|uniref:class II aldolase/adducin family protein n=1 Tax=Nonomuraea sp. MG754425 TaxID=2570319 RepID=UPI001F215477|nr:class II aldolase/adducin family protein [Nonomuraea sp. MG754425]MCF6467777.1 class II aldolase/adducin family protein [Nonomuraea sp. MG754425]
MTDRHPTDADLRGALVAANHILVREGVLDAFGHVSARTAPDADTFLLSRNLAPGSVTPSDLLVHRLDGESDDPRRPYLERFIHAEIYRRRPDVMAVVHSHSPSVIPFGVSDTPLRPVVHMAGFLAAERTPVYEISEHAGDASDLLITSPELGASLATALGSGAVALMRGHGSVTAGASIMEVVYRAVYTEVNARIQLQALTLGTPRYLSPGEAKAADQSVGAQARRAWDVWCRQVAQERNDTP